MYQSRFLQGVSISAHKMSEINVAEEVQIGDVIAHVVSFLLVPQFLIVDSTQEQP